jgi:hypothetical protein
LTARAAVTLWALFSSGSIMAQTHAHGIISDAATLAPMAGATVLIQAKGIFTYTTIATTSTSDDGAYEWTGNCAEFSAVGCRVRAQVDGYTDGHGDFDAAAQDVQIDIALHRSASVAGHVRWAADTSPASGMNLLASCVPTDENDCMDVPFVSTQSATDGSFTLSAMPAGSYQICTGGPDQDSVPQCYDHLDRSAFAGYPPFTPVVLTDGEASSPLDFDLSTGGTLAGRVFDGYTGMPLAGHSLVFNLFDANGDPYGPYLPPIVTASDGSYVLKGIPQGSYYLGVVDSAYPYVDYGQLYPGITCVYENCPPVTTATLLEVSTGITHDGIDFIFHPIATISGRIVDAADGHPLGGIRVQEAHCENGNCSLLSSTATSDAETGIYTLAVQDDPQIHVLTVSGRPYVDQVYPGIPCIFGQNCNAQGQDFAVQAGDHIQSVDFSMQLGGSLAGQTSFASGAPSPFATVWLYDSNFELVWSSSTDYFGLYQTPAWPPGIYYAGAANGWGCSFYMDRPCPADGQSPSSVQPTPIPLAQSAAPEYINFTLPVPDPIFRNGFDD